MQQRHHHWLHGQHKRFSHIEGTQAFTAQELCQNNKHIMCTQAVNAPDRIISMMKCRLGMSVQSAVHVAVHWWV